MKKIILSLLILSSVLFLFGCITQPSCGNGLCESGETLENCSIDCKIELVSVEDISKQINSASVSTILKSELESTDNGITCDSVCNNFGQTCLLGYRNMEIDVLADDVFTQRDGIMACNIGNGPAGVKYINCLCGNTDELIDKDAGGEILSMLNNCQVIEELGKDISQTTNGVTCDSIVSNGKCIFGYRDITNDSDDFTIDTQRDGIVSCDIGNGPANIRYIECYACSSDNVSQANKQLADEVLQKLNGASLIEVKKEEIEQTINGITCDSVCNESNKTCLFGYVDITNDDVDPNIQTQRDGLVSCNIGNGPANVNVLNCYCT